MSVPDEQKNPQDQEIPEAMKALHKGIAGKSKVLQGTNKAIRSAIESGALTPHDGGAIEIARALSRKVDNLADAEKHYMDKYLGGDFNGEEKPPPAPSDNTAIPTLLKVYEHLGLTPRSRAYIQSIQPKANVREAPGGGSKLAKFNRG